MSGKSVSVSEQQSASYAAARMRILATKKSGDKELDLSGIELKALPKEIGQLANLTELNLDNNQISEIPKEIGNSPISPSLISTTIK